MGTPVVLDFFSRQFGPVFDEKDFIQVDTLGQSIFGRAANGSQTVYSPDQNAFDYEVVRGNERLATLVPRGMNARAIGSSGATQPHQDAQIGLETYFTRKFPLIEETGSISGDFLLNRIPGEGPFQGLSRETRFRAQANRIYKELMRRTIRLDEFLAWQSILTGKQPSILNNTTDVYDFRRNAANIFTVGTMWSGAGLPLTDIDTACDLAQANGKVNPNVMIIGGRANAAFLGNAQLTTYSNKFYYNLTIFDKGFKVSPDLQYLVDGGAIPFGELRTPKGYVLTVFTYNKVYTSTAGAATKYMTETSAVVFSTAARADRFFGPPERLPMTAQDTQYFMELMGFNPMTPPLPANVLMSEGVIVPQSFFVDLYPSDDRKKATIRLQHAPVFATTQTDGFVTMNGLCP